MYIVKFTRKDNSIEEYFYHRQTDAEYHVRLFENDDSELYEKIELLNDK